LKKEIGSIRELKANNTVKIELKDIPSDHPPANVEKITIIDESKKILAYSDKIIFNKDKTLSNRFFTITLEEFDRPDLYKLVMPCEESPLGITLEINKNIATEAKTVLKPFLIKSVFERVLFTLICTPKYEINPKWKNLIEWIFERIPGDFEEEINEDSQDLNNLDEEVANKFIEEFMSLNFPNLCDLFLDEMKNERKKNVTTIF